MNSEACKYQKEKEERKREREREREREIPQQKVTHWLMTENSEACII